MSKRLSWLLRHGATDEGLDMDPAGWVDVPSVLHALRMTRPQLEEVVRTNNKQRLQLADDRVRACQGHSTDNRAVTREALEASWEPFEGPGPIWHGTSVDAAESIARDGILAVSRTHVHCADSIDSKVGKRAAVAVLLEIDVARLREAGEAIFRAPNGVVLVRQIPASTIVDVLPRTRRGDANRDRLRGLFGL